MFEIIIKGNDGIIEKITNLKTHRKAIHWCLDNLSDLFFEHFYEENKCEFEDTEGEIWKQVDDYNFWFKLDENDITTYEIKQI